MNHTEFCDLIAGVPAAALCDYFEVNPRTLRRWKSGDAAIPGAVARLARLRYAGDVAGLLGKEWEGFRFGSDGQLYIDCWRGGFDPAQIKGMFFSVQLVKHHESTIRAQNKRIEQLEQEVMAATEAAARYRRLVSHEARLGLMIERITG